jgi:phosphopantetheine adenylyltransferase
MVAPRRFDRLLWERAAIESQVGSRILWTTADLAGEQDARRAEGILRDLARAVEQPAFADAVATLTDFAGQVRAAHYLRSASAVESVVVTARRLIEAEEAAHVRVIALPRGRITDALREAVS